MNTGWRSDAKPPQPAPPCPICLDSGWVDTVLTGGIHAQKPCPRECRVPDVTDEERLAVARELLPRIMNQAPPDVHIKIVHDLCTADEIDDVGAYVFTQLIDAIVRARRPSA